VASEGRLTAIARGEVEVDEKVLVLRRIHVDFSLRGAVGQEPEARRAHEYYMPRCPIYRSIRAAIDVTSDLHLESGRP
jgi:hypothetical protein